ncbi:hypothetical protein [Kribbella sp. VKM Ac-2571]|uniref:hypothetical protein n=1 Tax=Kribbella sp. VKM Ac-2571 TaxID=2512222 RepID=UPI001060C305|nr:hypothetical protein [Kribbella sp. VKM Ac-2571]
MTDRVSLRFGSENVHISFDQVTLQAGNATHGVTLNFSSRATWLAPEPASETTPMLLTGTAWVDRDGPGRLGGLQPQVVQLRGYDASEKFVLDLSDDQLIALERGRGDDGVTFRLDLQGTLLHPPDGMHPVTDEQVTVRVPGTRWMELVEQAGSEVAVLIRVPSPLRDPSLPPADGNSAGSLTLATTRLAQARAELRDHRWEQSVGTCRKVLEILARTVKVPDADEVFNTPRRRRTQEQQWAAMYHTLKDMTHPAHHDTPHTSQFNWSRPDAEAILAATAGLLLRYNA